jgi:hypothetical protein
MPSEPGGWAMARRRISITQPLLLPEPNGPIRPRISALLRANARIVGTGA